jgi:hypothetical protein
MVRTCAAGAASTAKCINHLPLATCARAAVVLKTTLATAKARVELCSQGMLLKLRWQHCNKPSMKVYEKGFNIQSEINTANQPNAW